MTERRPVDVLAHEMALAKLARFSGDWSGYDDARERAIHLLLRHRIEDEVSRFRQVMTACTGYQNWGEDARERMLNRLMDALTRGIERGDSPHNVIVRMQRIPRAQITATLASEMRDGDGEVCIAFLLSMDGQLPDDIRNEFGDDPAKIAATFTDRDWADFAAPLLTRPAGEPRQDLMAEARKSLRRTLSAIGSQ